VETVAALRAIPGLDVIRPADPEETAGAFAAAFQRVDGPTLLALSRQNLPTLNEIPVEARRDGAFKGGYVAKKEEGALEMIVLASGSELQHALQAAGELGPGTRVVSMPCFERFERQDAAYKESVLPDGVRSAFRSKRGLGSLVSLRGPGWGDRLDRSLWHERTRRQSPGGPRDERGECRCGCQVSLGEPESARLPVEKSAIVRSTFHLMALRDNRRAARDGSRGELLMRISRRMNGFESSAR
jgi:hypothetical protein